MSTDAKIIAAINDMTARELAAVLTLTAETLPALRVEDQMRVLVHQLYRNDDIGAHNILANYDGGL